MAGKSLVLIDNIFDMYCLNQYQNPAIKFGHMLKSEHLPCLARAIRKICLSCPFPFKRIWFANWEQDLDEYPTIVLGDAGNTFNVVRYIKKKYPDKRVIVWYRNSVSATVSPYGINRKLCELWSFDRDDCIKYGMRYNPQFYIRNADFKNNDHVYDAFFVGKDKGRLMDLLELERTLEEKGLKTKFCIVGYNSDYLSYKEVLDHISRSRVIVDIQANWQDGITLRPLEALFYQKKLITNSVEIRTADYYRKSNIFVLGEDSLDGILDFINEPFEAVEEETINQYNEMGWMERFK